MTELTSSIQLFSWLSFLKPNVLFYFSARFRTSAFTLSNVLSSKISTFAKESFCTICTFSHTMRVLLPHLVNVQKHHKCLQAVAQMRRLVADAVTAASDSRCCTVVTTCASLLPSLESVRDACRSVRLQMCVMVHSHVETKV